ncbi:interleukin-12 subunit beta [Triplophysa rosa]|uniref:interleukin-12 subunit beta n=1 Tax=Triplophysa rosa TaxID=992332 RepID=UPI0025460DC6|nr:interleukin-12 subunit beta [Triplophysa rosa]
MGLLVRFILLLSLLIIISALNVFPEKFRFGEKHTTIILDCKTNKNSVTWKREEAHGTVDVDSEYEKPNGTKLIVYDLQEDQTGNYTCWSDEGLEDYIYLLLDKSKEASDLNLNCTAETFSCAHSLKCSWTLDDYTAFRLRNTRDHGSWVSPSVDGVFHVPHTTNSFSEESERLRITGEAVSSCCYIKTDYSVYLRDIVKPAGPNITKCLQRKNKEKVEVVVTPPSTWPQPHSFFPLKHQTEYEIRDNGKFKTHEWEGSKVEIQGVITKLRVRCRDPLLLSQWSEWTPWKNVQDNKKGKRSKAKKKNTKTRNQRKKGRKNQQ